MPDADVPALFDLPRRPGRPRNVRVAGQLAEALRHAPHLREEDRALVEVGRRLSLELDQADDPRALTQLAGALVPILDRLGLTPRGRQQLGLEQEPPREVNPLDELTLIRQSRRNAAVDPRP